ncbi:MAG: DJ-1/PfpI family protein [Clostridia bacterium]|nr:DJ-1/PfpI family protein [Clostridia bacterium]
MVYIILGTGFEPIEAIAPCDILRRGGVEVKFAGIGGTVVQAAHGITVQADCTVDEIEKENMEMIMLPGGMGGVNSMLGCESVLELVKFAWQNDRFVTAICAAPTIFAKLHITDGKKAVCYPGLEEKMGTALMQNCDAVRDGKLITGRAPGAAYAFGLALLEALRGADTAACVKKGLVY